LLYVLSQNGFNYLSYDLLTIVLGVKHSLLLMV